MIFWIFAILLLAAVTMALAMVRPRLNSAMQQGGASGEARAASLAIYKDQLQEISRDVERGMLSAADAEGQKAEIGRRMLAAAREDSILPASSGSADRRVPWVLVLVVPALAVPLYIALGTPDMPDLPRDLRMARAEQTGDLPALVARVEDHLAKRPDDATGWELLVPNYMNMGRYADAARAIGRVIELSGPSAERYAGLAEALTFDNGGMMTAPAIAAAKEAFKLDPKQPKVRYYIALGLAQGGKSLEAKQAFEALLAESPPDAPWRETVNRELAKLADPSAAPQIPQAQSDAAATMTPAEQSSMIRSMVDGLEEKLAVNPADAQGWLRLIRARSVMNEKDRALAALGRAREALTGDAAALAQLDTLAKELALQ